MAKSFSLAKASTDKKHFVGVFHRAVKRDDLDAMITLLWKENIRRTKYQIGYLPDSTYSHWMDYFTFTMNINIGTWKDDKILQITEEDNEHNWQEYFTEEDEEPYVSMDDIADYERYRYRVSKN